MGSGTDDELLEALAEVVGSRREHERREAELVRQLRAGNPPMPWERIAAVYGNSRKAVSKRFNAAAAGGVRRGSRTRRSRR